ncbi:MAG TPA: sulfurtransferase TusA family protein [Actinomycetes bacterium]
MDLQVTKVVDAKGQKCPMPVLLASRGIKELTSGQVMVLEATDGGSRSDIPAWARDTGNELIEATSEGGVFRYVIRKK